MGFQKPTFRTFSEFYPFYLSEHRNPVSRCLHFFGTCIVIAIFLFALVSGRFILLLWMPVAGYTFAWLGHFFFEKNKPATFRYPLYSLLGDFAMFRDILSGRIKFQVTGPKFNQYPNCYPHAQQVKEQVMPEIKINVTQTGVITSEASIRNHTVVIDRPEAKGGEDKGPMGGGIVAGRCRWVFHE